MAKLRVLVVDDSAYNRQTISEILTSHGDIEVVGKAYDGEEALKLVSQVEPDLITLDLEMPRMDGFTFLRLIMSQRPTPIIVISSHSRKQEVFQALELGAIDFIAKPTHHIAPDLTGLRNELIEKALTVRSLRALPVRRPQRRATGPVRLDVSNSRRVVAPERLICIGASTGGPPALESLFKAVGAPEGCAFLVAQHMPAKFTRAFAERLDRMSPMTIVEAEQGMAVSGGWAFVAPGGQHLSMVSETNGRLSLTVRSPRAEDRYVPSVDMLFETVAAQTHLPVLAVVLTGMGSDGSQGIRHLRRQGARTIAESRESSIVFGMPKEAIDTGCVEDVLSLDSIIERVQRFANGE